MADTRDGTLLNMKRRNPWIGCLLAATAALVGCAPKTNVSATGNVPAAYSHVYMSIKEIWFNTDAAAGPDDTTWAKYPLTTPATVDLATALGGQLNSITTGLNVPIGTYAQIRLIPVDASDSLLSSASGLGAVYNSEVDYTDSDGAAHQVPLELLNPDRGLGVTASVQVKGDTTNILASSSSSSSSTDTSSTDPTTTDTTTTTSTGTTPAATFQLAINVDGAKDIVPFTYSNVTGMLLNPHIVAYDQAAVGGISGTLDVSNLTGVSGASSTSYLNIQVTAESLSTDGTRHVAVNSAPVATDGTFTIYPLSTSSSSPTSYDLVIHGPGIATIVIKGVPVSTIGDPSSVTPVNIGTVTPRAATSFKVNLNTTNPLPAGVLVGFYQTLPGSTEVPYLIDAQPIDPFSRTFSADQSESTGNLDYGTYASGSNVTLTAANPTEGVSTYRVAATAPLFTDGVLTTTITAPSSSSTLTVAVPTLAAASGAALNAATVTISKSSSTKYNKGELIFSHDGAIVQTASLDSLLTQSANGVLTISGLPGGSSSGQFADGIYYVSVRVWNTSDPSNTVVREIYPTALDLRSGASLVNYQLNID